MKSFAFPLSPVCTNMATNQHSRGQTVAAAETDTTNPGKPAKDTAWPLAAVVGFVAMVHVIWWLLGDTVVAYGNLVDSDGYARLVRVERLLETGAWFDSSLPRPRRRRAGHRRRGIGCA